MKLSIPLAGVLQTTALVLLIDLLTAAAVIGIGIAAEWPTPWHFGRNMLIAMVVLWAIGYGGSRGGGSAVAPRIDTLREQRARSVSPLTAEQWQKIDAQDRAGRASFFWLMMIAGGGIFVIGLAVMALFPPTPGVPTQ